VDANEFDIDNVYRPPDATEATASVRPTINSPRASLPRSTWNGAKIGVRWTSYIAGPISVVLITVCFLIAAFGLGSGHGWRMPAFLPGAFGFYVVFAGYGLVIGAVIGLVGALIGRALAGTRLASRRASSDRHGVQPLIGTATAQHRRVWPWLVGMAVLTLLAAAFSVGVVVASVVDRRLAEAIAAADRDDPNWRLEDLLAHRDPVRDDENSAIVLDQALSFLPENWWQGEGSKLHDRLSPIAANVRLDDATALAISRELEKYRDAVRIARTVADYRRGRHELELGPTLLDTPLPETQAARGAARLLTLDAAIRVHDGDPDGALDSCRAIIGVGRSIGDEPFAISHLVRIAIGETAILAIRRVLGQSEPSVAALTRLQAAVADELAEPLLLYGMKGERATLTELIRRVGAGELPISALSDSNFDPNAPRPEIAPWGKLMFDNQRAVALEWLNQAVVIARRPPAGQPRLWDAWQAEVDRVRHSRLGAYTSTLPTVLMAGFSSYGSAHSRYQAGLGATAILLAAERHRRKTGEWPATIVAIDPNVLRIPPVDPYSGQPFRLEHRDGQLLVYSVGKDREDEHGAYEPKRWREGRLDDVGTAAWDVPHRRQPP